MSPPLTFKSLPASLVPPKSISQFFLNDLPPGFTKACGCVIRRFSCFYFDSRISKISWSQPWMKIIGWGVSGKQNTKRVGFVQRDSSRNEVRSGNDMEMTHGPCSFM